VTVRPSRPQVLVILPRFERPFVRGARVTAVNALVARLPRARRQQLRRVLRRPRWGNLRRPTPFSATFGYDRGTPIDRYYLDRFLTEEGGSIRGVVGEIAGTTLVDAYGGSRVTRTEVIDLDDTNPRVTLLADLGRPSSLPSSRFDCLVVVQTLQYVAEPDVAIANCIQALRPGGTLLLALPALAAHDDHERDEDDHWRFWPGGVAALATRVAPGASVRTVAYGNLVTALAFLHGLAAEELRPAELAHTDLRFPVVVCARIERPVGSAGG
jgi:SAM-dependent methyltransferase